MQDIPVSGKLVYLCIKTARFKCQDCESTFYEQFDCIDGRDRLTRRFREYLQEHCLQTTFTDVARQNALTPTTVRRIFGEYVGANKEKLRYIAPRVLGIDEAHLNKIMRCVITDTENNLLLDILEDREAETIISFIRSMEHPENIKVVTMDMYRPYRFAILKALPSVKIVVDRFHVVQLVNRKMDEVRAATRATLDAQGRKAMLYISKLMKANKEALSPKSTELLRNTFRVYPKLGTAYYLKEAIRNVYRAPNRIEAGYRFQEFLRSVPSDLTPMVTAKETFQEWAREIMNYFDYPYTNAYTESANNLIKKLNKEGRSLSFEQMRFKALFSTRATWLPKFDIKTASYSKSDSFSMMTTMPIKPQKVLVQGFGVDINELLASL